MKEFVQKHVGRSVDLWRRYEHRLGVGALVVGFIFDIFLAKRPDSVVDNILLVSYLFIAASIIILLNVRTRRQMEKQDGTAAPLILLLILQFCFGGLASNLLVLYGKSGTLAASALFILLLVSLVFGNEYLRSRYSQLRFNIAVYYFLLLTYCIISVPTFIFHSIGDWVFLASGVISLIVIGIFLSVLFAAVLKGDRKKQVQEIALLIGGIFIVFNGLYFSNIIPPVPLSLKGIGMYHSILRYSSGDYLAMYEAAAWFEFWQDTNSTFHYTQGQSAYCFSSVYAPTDLSAPIYHHWEHYNETTKQWDTVSRVSFPIEGGRSEGYRGWSATAALSPGQWRCDVETSAGSLVGRVSFTAVEVSAAPTLSTTTL